MAGYITFDNALQMALNKYTGMCACKAEAMGIDVPDGVAATSVSDVWDIALQEAHSSYDIETETGYATYDTPIIDRPIMPIAEQVPFYAQPLQNNFASIAFQPVTNDATINPIDQAIPRLVNVFDQ